MKMKKIYKKKFLNKLIILTVLLLAPITSLAEIDDKKWTKEWVKDNKKSCVIAINSQVAIPDSDKKQTIATAFIRIGSQTKKNMALIDGEEKTYKLEEEKISVPVLFVQLPLNSDLQKNPLISIGKQKIANVKFTHCNQSVGCSTNISLNDKAIELLKEGKELTVTIGVYGNEKNMTINFPLKKFTKSYKNLLK